MQRGESDLDRLIQEKMFLVEQCLVRVDIPEWERDDAKQNAMWGLCEALETMEVQEEGFEEYAIKKVYAKMAEMVGMSKTAESIMNYDGSVKEKTFKPFLDRISKAYANNSGCCSLSEAHDEEVSEEDFLKDIFSRCRYEDIINYILNYKEDVERDVLLAIFSGETKEDTLFRMRTAITEYQYESIKENFVKMVQKDPMLLRFDEYKAILLAGVMDYRIGFYTSQPKGLMSLLRCYKVKLPKLNMQVEYIDGIVRVIFDANISAIEHIMLVMRAMEHANITLFPVERQFFMDRI